MSGNRPIARVNKTEVLLRQFYAQQSKLRGYVFSATRDYHATEEILQSTAIVVAQKAGVFDDSRDTAPWFLGIAKNYIQAWYRTQGRAERNLSFDILEQCIPCYESFDTDLVTKRRLALNACIQKLPSLQKEIVNLRYSQNLNCAAIADKTGRSLQSIYALLKRLKLDLRKCVELRMTSAEPQL